MTTEEPEGVHEAPDRPGALEWVSLYGRQLGVVADMYLSVLGACLIALAAVVLLDGFGFVSAGYTGTTGALLGSGFVLAVIGLFALGVASEGPLSGDELPAPELHVAIARAVGVLAVCLVANAAAGYLAEPAAGVSYPFVLGVVAMQVAARAGLVFVLPIGVAGTWALRVRFPAFRRGWDRLALLGAWVLASWVVLASSL